jgi:hypothetical protein
LAGMLVEHKTAPVSSLIRRQSRVRINFRRHASYCSAIHILRVLRVLFVATTWELKKVPLLCEAALQLSAQPFPIRLQCCVHLTSALATAPKPLANFITVSERQARLLVGDAEYIRGRSL